MKNQEFFTEREFVFNNTNYKASFGYSKSPNLIFTVSGFDPHLPVKFPDFANGILTFGRDIESNEIILFTEVQEKHTLAGILIPILEQLYSDLIK